MDDEFDGVAAGLSNCITRDGQSSISSDIPWNNKKITGLADAAGDTHALNRKTGDARYTRNAADLTQETALAADDEFPFYDTSASANRSSTYANLRANLGFPTGTKMLFVQTSAPVGWTKDTTHNDKALRVVSGSASHGGSSAFSTVFAARTLSVANLPEHTHGPGTLTTSSDGAHTHTYEKRINGAGGAEPGSSLFGDPQTTSTSSNGAHTHTLASGVTGSTGSGTALDFAVHYVDVIIATKD